MPASEETYLFIGVGGMGMAPLAGWMARAGYAIVGYDDNLQERVRCFLDGAGVELRDFVFSEQLAGFTTVVYSSAIQADHPLLAAARELGLKTLRRGEMLAEIAATKRLIAVVGSHGKTTTSGMIAHGVRHCGVDANYILGGLFNDEALPPSQYMDSDWLIAEVDESDGTIDHFSPEVTVVLNVDWDHADRYSSGEMLDAAFRQLITRTKAQVLLSTEGDLTGRFIETGGAELLTFGVNGDYCVHADTDGTLQLSGRLAEVQVESPAVGRFNQINGAAALAVLSVLAAELRSDVLSSFGGMARRQTVLHRDEQLTVLEDYAHHPTEIAALFECLRSMAPARRLVVVFQPHRYSRTKQFKREFAEILESADQLFLLPVYAAHESVIEGGTIAELAQEFSGEPPEVLTMNPSGLQRLVDTIGSEPSTVAFVGAGDIDQFGGLFTSMRRCEFDLDAAWRDFLKGRVSPNCVLKENEPMANKTTMRIGGAAQFYAEPSNLCDLRALLRAAKLFDLETFCLGRGSNLLVPDEGFPGLVIRFSGTEWRRSEALGDGRIWAGAGVRLKEVCGHAAKAGLAGFEFLEGIPGAIGGALRMNAGAMGNWMFDVVERVQFLDEAGQLQDLPKDAFHFGYRKVEEISRGIALGAILKSLEAEDEASIRERMDSYSSSRKASQPRDPSAGCIFKNPEGNFAGKLIDTYGVKGMRVGAAEVSDVHGNFIVNRGGATATDVIELVRKVRAAIHAKSGYILEPEVLLLGQAWDDVLGDVESLKGGTNCG
ncbi:MULTISPECIES: UDP-N-acetylmuramate dehydrogenase [unclassified Lentimonas]|uniref:UDP-N-acetylmuramate dehydrogenase n=1 Tax=unclassified Lentimonas TaxID=2630993 RepID=UPI00132A152F|nr:MULTISPECIES: UDP-N-acetylmuramate dehydrogenase [unclassified Lentimonas]CAA6692916.1 UDP-N-acetylmuramate--alanine ligase (EC [Lentimonas sp. CC19]CAA6695756.1 UDP-N-acetylmuramate--alanine ligase (EC [Lentimonas sp. CC10]CAA7069587.1 UDP-N-acetylmuramate--alanine ligase (EC [Lentimonas sp. CC11]